MWERADWQLFLDPATLGQKAGAATSDLCRLALKEAIDNALDIGANASITKDGGTWVIADDGPSIDPREVPRLFSVNRPLLSSKLRRLPTRGALGNGLRVVVGAVAAAKAAWLWRHAGIALHCRPAR
jgi:hypothetical protein